MRILAHGHVNIVIVNIYIYVLKNRTRCLNIVKKDARRRYINERKDPKGNEINLS
jgi:hypothetical protein